MTLGPRRGGLAGRRGPFPGPARGTGEGGPRRGRGRGGGGGSRSPAPRTKELPFLPPRNKAQPRQGVDATPSWCGKRRRKGRGPLKGEPSGSREAEEKNTNPTTANEKVERLRCRCPEMNAEILPRSGAGGPEHEPEHEPEPEAQERKMQLAFHLPWSWGRHPPPLLAPQGEKKVKGNGKPQDQALKKNWGDFYQVLGRL